MPEYLPFRGIRYDLDRIDEIDRVVAPPYDVLSDEDVRDLYQKSEFNVVRLDLGTAEPDARENAGDWYRRSGDLLRLWRREGVLRTERDPAFYVLRQTYRLDGGSTHRVTGVIGACRLTPFSQGQVLPHEHTFSKPKEDRLRLMRATSANLSQIYSFYSDPSLGVERVLEAVMSAPTDVTARDDEGQVHELWVVTDSKQQSHIKEALADRPFFIADGHHRYETALAYRDERRAEEGDDPRAGWNYVMMFAVNLDAGGMSILSTHRLIKDVPLRALEEAESSLRAWYRVEERQASPESGLAEAAETVSEETGAVACYLGSGRWWWIVPKNRDALTRAVPGDRSEAVKALTVTALHELVMPLGLGIGHDLQHGGEHIEYLREAGEGVRRVDRGEAQALIYVPAPRPKDVCAVARAGDVMPHKSTYFYPKLLTGLVLNDLSDSPGIVKPPPSS